MCINEMLGQSGSSTKDIEAPTPLNTKEPTVWQEVKGDDGNNYFWNIQTNETTWDPPDNYISLAQQEEKKHKDKADQKREKKLKKQKQNEAKMEVKAHIAREKMRELAVEKDKPPPFRTDFSYGPAPFVNPLGEWKPVVKEIEQKIDLQLPKSEKQPIPPPVVMEPEKIVFKEKRVESLGDGPVEFKKRKFNNPKRNMRQKLDDD